MTYEAALLVDVATLLVCVPLLVRAGRLAHSHPATIYLVFHGMVVSARLLALILGAPALFSDVAALSNIEPISEEEIAGAAMTADVVLAAMTIAWLRASSDATRAAAVRSVKSSHFRTLSANLVRRVAWAVLPIGIAAIGAFAKLPGVGRTSELASFGEWQESAIFLIVQTWVGVALVALIYVHGPRWRYIVPLSGYLLVMMYQGFHRFRVVIPVLLVLQIILDRAGRRWPTKRATFAIAALVLLFYPMKQIGRLAQEGASFDEVWEASRRTIDESLLGRGGDQILLDEFASALTLVDNDGRYHWGAPYLAALTIWVPRQWWPDKPSTADYLADISRPWRPMREAGMAVTLSGESYANFGWAGMLLIPAALAYVLGRFYFAAYRAPYQSVVRFAYLMVASLLIQVYRDGLVSLPVFLLLNVTPLTLIVMAHAWAGRTRGFRSQPAGSLCGK